MQIFARNPRKFRKKAHLKQRDIEIFKERLKDSGIEPLIIHTPYTLNLAASKKFLHWITIKEFTQDIIEADKLGADFIVTHTGCYKGFTEEKGLKSVVRALRRILRATDGLKTKILLENTSGAGTWLGYKFSHYHYIIKELDFTERVGVCLDTAHAWSAGYRVNTTEGLDQLIAEIDREVGLDRLRVIHLNDTRDELGSKKDRHYHIGEGKIGQDGFSLIVNHPLLKELPFILETPKKSDEDDVKNLATIRRIYKDAIH
jgi:deoxyribonuclease-4